jgi:GrpB-like predicted nucleotidyltransferase (UPF0157 family)
MPRKRGRPPALHTGKVTDPRQRHLGSLQRDIAVVSTDKPHVKTQRGIVNLLWKKPQYQSKYENSRRKLERDVAKALAKAARMRRLEGFTEDLDHVTTPQDMVRAAWKWISEIDTSKKTLKYLRDVLRDQLSANNH